MSFQEPCSAPAPAREAPTRGPSICPGGWGLADPRAVRLGAGRVLARNASRCRRLFFFFFLGFKECETRLGRCVVSYL